MGKTTINYLILVFLALIWGSSFILMKRGLEVFDYIQLANLRICIAFISLIPFLPNAIKLVKKRHYLPIFISALLGNGIPAFLFASAQTELESSLVGTLNAIVPLFTLILGVYFFGTKVSKVNILGVFIGLFATGFLAFRTTQVGAIFNGYIILVVFGGFCYAISINVIKKYLYDLDASSIAALAFFIIGPLALLFLFFDNSFYKLKHHPEFCQALGYIALLSVLGTSMAAIIFNKLLQRSSAIFVSSITYLIPIVALFWGVIDGEIITIHHTLGLVIILSSVYLITKKS